MPTELQRERIIVESICKAHFMMMDPDLWLDTAQDIDEAMQGEACHMVLIAGDTCSGKTSVLAHWKKQHVLKNRDIADNAHVDFSACALANGPRADLSPHLLISTFVSHLSDPRIDIVLRHLYSEIRRLTPCDRSLPVDGQSLQEFPAFMTDAAKIRAGVGR
jgi:hypothetical protein